MKDDSESLSSMAAGDSSSDDARVQSTKTSTPATSVIGEDKRSTATTSTRRATLSRKSTARHADSDSELSEPEELGSQPAKKKLKQAVKEEEEEEEESETG